MKLKSIHPSAVAGTDREVDRAIRDIRSAQVRLVDDADFLDGEGTLGAARLADKMLELVRNGAFVKGALGRASLDPRDRAKSLRRAMEFHRRHGELTAEAHRVLGAKRGTPATRMMGHARRKLMSAGETQPLFREHARRYENMMRRGTPNRRAELDASANWLRFGPDRDAYASETAVGKPSTHTPVRALSPARVLASVRATGFPKPSNSTNVRGALTRFKNAVRATRRTKTSRMSGLHGKPTDQRRFVADHNVVLRRFEHLMHKTTLTPAEADEYANILGALESHAEAVHRVLGF